MSLENMLSEGIQSKRPVCDCNLYVLSRISKGIDSQ